MVVPLKSLISKIFVQKSLSSKILTNKSLIRKTFAKFNVMMLNYFYWHTGYYFFSISI